MNRAREPACLVINKKLRSLIMSRIFSCICKANTDGHLEINHWQHTFVIYHKKQTIYTHIKKQ